MRAYLDWASAAPLAPVVIRGMQRALSAFANPSSVHAEGRDVAKMLANARQRIARSLNTKPEELVLTSGGTEANHLAIVGTLRALRKPVAHCITSTIEHASVMTAFQWLADMGVQVSYVAPNDDGRIAVDAVQSLVNDNTVLVSFAHVNSEIGVVQPIADIGRMLKKINKKIIFHVDAAQSPLYFDASPHTLHADLVSYDAQKIMGPKGAGVLYRDFSVPLAPIIGGGSQERGMRPGTENALAAVGASYAFEFSAHKRKQRVLKVLAVRELLINSVLRDIPAATLTGSRRHRSPSNAHFHFQNVDGDYLTVLMDEAGVAVSPRSACAGGGGVRSDVVYALTNDNDLARGTIRFSLGPTTTSADIQKAVRALKKVLPLATHA
ncbi:MAG: cysteine desulfurase family protein [Patescibacteria group bacterium]